MPKKDCDLYCQTCVKNIYDFRGKNLDEISKIRRANPEISCGVFDAEVASADSRTTVQNIFRIAFAAIFVLGFNISTLFAQPTDRFDTSVKYTEVVAGSAFVMGQVLNHNGKPIQATVSYSLDNGENVTFETGKDGKFEFELPADFIGQKVYITLTTDGFYSKYLTIDELSNKCHSFEVQLSKVKKHRGRRKYIAGYFY